MGNSSERISVDQAKAALLRSGYLLESRLETVLRNQGYYVEANSAYADPETGKSRELDLYALQGRQAGPNDGDYVFVALLIECVNTPQPMAFISKEPQVGFLHQYAIKLAGLPMKIPVEGGRNSWLSLTEHLSIDKYHHYCKGRIATQFCSFTKKKNQQDWMATHDQSHFDSLRNLSTAVDYFVDKHFKNWSFRLDQHEDVNLEFYYPVLVVQGNLLDIRPSKKGPKLIKANHLQYRRSTVVGAKDTDYQIDLVSERFFPKYLEIVEGELSRTARLLRRRHQIVRKAIKGIARNARRARSRQNIRDILNL